MKYTITNTEINNKRASEFETKSLLYLVGFRKDSHEVDVLAIDCLNDVTGINKSFDKLWDVQAKNHSTLTPKKIGKFLYTLFDNYTSEVDFFDYILFVPKLTSDYLIDDSLMTYGIDNINTDTKKRIKNGLISEIKRVLGSCNELVVDSFLNIVLIVQDNKKISTYIKGITRFKNKKIRGEDFYKSVFEDIRDIQSVKKNSYIEGVVLTDIKDVLSLNRHFYAKDINTLIINRIIGCDIFATPYTISFLPEIRKTVDDDSAKDLLQDCKSNLSRAFFNKNSNKEFWIITEFLISYLADNTNSSIYESLTELHMNTQIKSSYFNEKSLLFLISLIKDGLKDEN
jgi:hypothetical protein